jgi:hypothetical protein
MHRKRLRRKRNSQQHTLQTQSVILCGVYQANALQNVADYARHRDAVIYEMRSKLDRANVR